MNPSVNTNPIILAPSLLAGDHARLADSLKIVEQAGCQWLHLDIMDGHFVPNLSFGPQTVKALRPHSRLFFDVHLMLSNPHSHVESFLDAGADQITIHVEPDYPIEKTLETIRAAGKRCGVVLNPDTPASALAPWLKTIDMVLLMTVQPGFGGQSFRTDVLPKIADVAAMRREASASFRIQVDGGIGLETAEECKKAGADTLVAGTAFFKAANHIVFRRAVERNSLPD
jgi:ribulose-phosphate 3-epimerase